MMVPIASITTGVLALFSLFTLCLGGYAAVRLRAARGAGAFALLMVSIAVYCLGYGLEVSGGTLERIMSAIRFEYFGIATLPAFWILFSVQYTGGGKRLARRLAVGLLFLSALIVAAVFSNDLHHLYYRTIQLDSRGPFPLVVIGRGPLYYAGLAYVIASLVIGAVLFTRMLIFSPAAKKPQAVVMLVGSFVPGITNILYQLGLRPWSVDPNPFAMTATAFLYALGLFRFHLLDVVPVALDAVFRAMRDGVIILDCDGRVADFNARAREVLQETCPLRLRSFLRDGLASRSDLLDRIEGESAAPEDVRIDVRGEPRRFDLRVSTVRDTGERVVGRTIVLVDTTERARLLEELRMLAVTDELTGVCNRRHFLEHARIEMDRARRTGKPVSAVAIDLDHFKSINDAYGHAAGDAVLRAAAGLWKGRLRATDILGRCGGEEFSILLPETPLDMASLVAGRLRAATEALTVDAGGRGLGFTASFGIACLAENDGTDPAGLLARADAALYEAKEGGRNRVMVAACR